MRNTQMRKTQVFLTEDQLAALKRVARTTGRKQSEIIRRGVELAVDEAGKDSNVARNAALDAAFGLWKDRDDIDDLMTTMRDNNRRVTDRILKR